MFGVVAFIFFALAYILGGSDAHTSAWLTPPELMYAGLACLALHFSGFVYNRRP